MNEPRFIVGIDLGTTHTVVASVEVGSSERPRIFPIEQLIAPGEVAPRPLLSSLRYHPADGELGERALDLPWARELILGEPPRTVIGELALALGSRVPGRLVASAKSWLSYAGVDRTAAILPWGAPADVPRVSPVVASASYLAHVRAAWDHAHPDAPLSEQEVVLTIPASFDEGARALTLEAARLGSLPKVRLVEEPQAAFYDWLSRQDDLGAATAGTRLALVVDVGGGTTDLTFIRIEPRDGAPRLTRVAVGDHLMLGGDNMDLALAKDAEGALGGALGPARFAQLVAQCRAAKEALLGDAAPERAKISVLGGGSRLVGGTLSTELDRAAVHARIVDGFFPTVALDASVARRAGAIVELGLPFVAEPAVTRHVAAFVRRHQDVARDAVPEAERTAAGLALPDAVLLNGGVFRGAPLRERMIGVLSGWLGRSVRVLPNAEPELAVALGAVAYGLARRGLGMKIGGGSARSYFLLLDAQKGAAAGVGGATSVQAPPSSQPPSQLSSSSLSSPSSRRGLCLLPRGTEEGEEVSVRERSFALRLGRPVRFHLASSVGEAAYVRPGEIVEVDDELFRELPPIAAVLEEGTGDRPIDRLSRASIVPTAGSADGSTSDGTSGSEPRVSPSSLGPARPGAREVRVRLVAQLTEIGTMEVGCVDEATGRRWSLEQELRGSAAGSAAPARIGQLHPRFAEAKDRIEQVFGKSDAGAEGRGIKTLRADLEKILGAREGWTVPLLRELWGSLFAGVKRRRRSADHERVWLNLVGFTLRPGLGYPLDEWRVDQLEPLFTESVQFAPEAQVWAEWWTLWRRIAGGTDAATQRRILSALDYYLHPPTPRPRPRPPGPRAQGYEDMVRLAGSLERISQGDKARVGGWLVERLTQHGEGASSWWAVGRLGARVPFYGSAHEVAPRAEVEAWLVHALRLDWRAVEQAAFAAVQLARRSGDRARDVSEALRTSVLDKLRTIDAPPTWSRMVEQALVLEAQDERRVFGESLPPGLVLVDE